MSAIFFASIVFVVTCVMLKAFQYSIMAGSALVHTEDGDYISHATDLSLL